MAQMRRLRHQRGWRPWRHRYFIAQPPTRSAGFGADTADAVLTQAWGLSELASENAGLFALGKLGAQELNLSSDVDLVVVASPDSQPSAIRKLREFRRLLTEVTEFGFCFRLDFDLRPGGQSHAIVSTPAHFQEHYWARGEAWEKMALARLRAITGPTDLIASILEHARLFSYRRFLDFTLLEDLKQVRSRIHHEGFEPKSGEIHLKLERGGIRDIELFVNSLQVLHGGKIPKLQTHSTEVAFQQIKNLHIVPLEEIEFLHNTYWDFRLWENLTQALDDRQTHYIGWPQPWSDPSWPKESIVREHMKRVDEIVSQLLPVGTAAVEAEIPPEAEQAKWLAGLGFNEESINRIWPSVMAASALSQKTDRDERARRRFLFQMVHELAKTKNDKDLGLGLLHDFIRAIRAKAAFFTLLNREPRLIRDLARLFSFSPYLASIFTSRPELIDNFVLNIDEPFSGEFETMLDEMAGRKFLSEVMASIAFLADLDTPALMEALTATADIITGHLLDRLAAEFGGKNMDILCLGKWGGRELGLKSDLDFIFLTEAAPSEKEQKTAKRFISRLTDPYRGGSLYDIDLRLRPSGKAGPILTTRGRLEEYLKNEAHIWERQAYLRARSLKTSGPLETSLLWHRPLTKSDLEKLSEIRLKLIKPATPEKIDLKYSPGGLIDIEFAVQISVLSHRLERSSPNTSEILDLLTAGPWGPGGKELKKNYDRLRSLEQLFTLASNIKSSEFRTGSDALRRSAHLLGAEEWQLQDEISANLRHNQEWLKSLDPRQDPT